MDKKAQLDFNKLYCHLHPLEIITNYCNDEKCLLGLCATCVCSHTQIHAQMGTIPQYQNIRDTFSSLQEQARNQISCIQDDKNRLGRLREQVEIKKITIRKTIRQLKQDTVNKIKQDFDQLEKKIMNDIVSEEKKQGYHCQTRFQTLRKNFNRETETLYNYLDGLNSPCFLDWSKKLKRDLLQQSEAIRKNLEKQLQDNETYTANLKWNQPYLNDISFIIKKMFSLQFVVPKMNTTTVNQIIINQSINSSRASSMPKFTSSVLGTTTSFHKRNETGNSFWQNQSDLSLLKQSIKPSTPQINEYLACDMSESKIYGKQNGMYRSSFRNDDNCQRSSMMSNLNYTPKMGESTLNRQSRLRIL